MKTFIACLGLWLVLVESALAVIDFEELFPPPTGSDDPEDRNPTQHVVDKEEWEQALFRLDSLEAELEIERSKFGEVTKKMLSVKEDFARHSEGIARMETFAETVQERLKALEKRVTAKDTRERTDKATMAPERPNNQPPSDSAEEQNQGSDTDEGSQKPVEETTTPRVEITTVSPLCLTSSPPPRESTKFNKTVTDSGVIAEYKCKSGHFNIGGSVHVSKCDAAGTWSDVDISCNNFTTCSYLYRNRRVYGGTHATTVKGRTCQKWKSFKPHRHQYASNMYFRHTTWTGAESLDDVANYCRDPGIMKTLGSLWCYTTDRRHRWEKCEVPDCVAT